MKEFLTGPALHRAVASIAKSGRFYCAVAFWGDGATKFIGGFEGRDVRIVCNLNHIGTNPRVISKFPRASVRRHDALHAKVYIGDDYTIVTSANASANGLGFGSSTSDGWIEAGIKYETTEEVVSWFLGLWSVSATISDSDIEAAVKAWLARPRASHRPLPVLTSQSDRRKWTREACFKHFGAVCRNPRWSWSARSNDGKTVVMTMWDDEIVWDGKVATYGSLPKKSTRNRPGESERLENLKWALDHCDGIVRVVRMSATHKDPYTRKIAKCFPDDGLIMRVVHLDEKGRTFRARSI